MATPTTQNKRLINFLLDQGMIIIISVIIFIICILLGYAFIEEEYSLFYGLVLLLYYVLTETIWGKSPAKFLTKTKIVMLDGTKPNLWRIILRTICRFIPFDVVSFLFYPKYAGFHDQFSGTLVVDENGEKE